MLAQVGELAVCFHSYIMAKPTKRVFHPKAMATIGVPRLLTMTQIGNGTIANFQVGLAIEIWQ